MFTCPKTNARPRQPDEILNPEESKTVTIVEGSSLETQQQNFMPKEVRTAIGVDNRVIWQNDDSVAHSVTNDEYVDQINGKFDSMDTIGLVPPGETYEFTFTEVGEYPYYCVPHPWMTGTVVVVENFA